MQSIAELRTTKRRLDSWKEIAAFFGRDERTVRRWEREKALPVHRLPGSSRGRVFAFTDELTRWMNSAGSAEVTILEPASSGGQAAGIVPDADELERLRSRRRRRSLWIALAGMVILLIAGVIVFLADRGPLESQADSTAINQNQAAHSAASTTNAEAQDLYLKGRYYWNKRTPDDLNRAVDFFTQSIVHDPDYAPAYVGLADSYNLLREYTAMSPEEAFPRALAAARKAVELDPSSAEAHNSLAFVTFYWKWDASGAEREFRRALELNPNYVTAHHWYATFLMCIGRIPEALEEINRAQQLDPSSTPILADKGLILFHVGQTDESLALLKQLAEAQPNFYSTHIYLSYIHFQQGDYPNYLVEARKAAQLSKDAQQMAVVNAAERGYKHGGRQAMLEGMLQEQTKLSGEGEISDYALATTYGRLRDTANAMNHLQISKTRHEPEFISVGTDDAFIYLHQDPAFRDLMAKAGLPPLP